MGYILICEDNYTGILSGIYDAYKMKLPIEETQLQIGNEGNLQLFAEYITVIPDEHKAKIVSKTIISRLGEEVAGYLNNAIASEDPDKGNAILQTVTIGLREKGSNILSFLQNDYVRKVFELSRYVGGEVHHLYGFLRFRELDNGILFSAIGPRNNVVAMLAPHFADRFPSEDFVIYDEIRNICAVHPKGKSCFMASGDSVRKLSAEKMNDKEEAIQQLFRHFVKTIAIESRFNPKCQRTMLPLRFRPYMTEFNEA